MQEIKNKRTNEIIYVPDDVKIPSKEENNNLRIQILKTYRGLSPEQAKATSFQPQDDGSLSFEATDDAISWSRGFGRSALPIVGDAFVEKVVDPIFGFDTQEMNQIEAENPDAGLMGGVSAWLTPAGFTKPIAKGFDALTSRVKNRLLKAGLIGSTLGGVEAGGRTRLNQALGIEDGDWGDVASDAGWGATLGGAFGTGLTGASMLGRRITNPGSVEMGNVSSYNTNRFGRNKATPAEMGADYTIRHNPILSSKEPISGETPEQFRRNIFGGTKAFQRRDGEVIPPAFSGRAPILTQTLDNIIASSSPEEVRSIARGLRDQIEVAEAQPNYKKARREFPEDKERITPDMVISKREGYYNKANKLEESKEAINNSRAKMAETEKELEASLMDSIKEWEEKYSEFLKVRDVGKVNKTVKSTFKSVWDATRNTLKSGLKATTKEGLSGNLDDEGSIVDLATQTPGERIGKKIGDTIVNEIFDIPKNIGRKNKEFDNARKALEKEVNSYYNKWQAEQTKLVDAHNSLKDLDVKLEKVDSEVKSLRKRADALQDSPEIVRGVNEMHKRYDTILNPSGGNFGALGNAPADILAGNEIGTYRHAGRLPSAIAKYFPNSRFNRGRRAFIDETFGDNPNAMIDRIYRATDRGIRPHSNFPHIRTPMIMNAIVRESEDDT